MSTVIASPVRVASALPRAFRAFRASIAIIAFIALWEVLPRIGWVDATFLPPFSTVLRALYEMDGGIGRTLGSFARKCRARIERLR